MTATAPVRVLLVSGIPPGSANVGEIALREMTAGYVEGGVVCLALTPPGYRHVSGSTTVHPIVLHPRPEEGRGGRPGGVLGRIAAVLDRRWRFEREVSAAVDHAVELGRHHGVGKVWMVLDCPATLAMGSAVAKRLGQPLLSLVWDMPDYLLRHAQLDRLTRARLGARFADSMRRSERVAVVSEPMARVLEARYAARTIVVRTPVSPEDPVGDARRGDEYTIAFAGSLHATSAWRSLLAALALRRWRVRDRPVRVRVLSTFLRMESTEPVQIEYLGFQPEAIRDEVLRSADLLYLPMPFEERLADLSSYSFPAKLSSYIAAGRPVFVHAPRQSALALFAQQHPIGVLCVDLDPERIAAALDAFAVDAAGEERSRAALARLAVGEFSARECHRRFEEFVSGNAPAPTGAATAAPR